MAGRQNIQELHERALSDLEWPILCSELAQLCASDAAQQRLRELTPEPTLELAATRARLSQAAIDAEQSDAALPRVTTPDVLDALDGITRQRVLAGPDLLKILLLLRDAGALRRFAQSQRAAREELAAALDSAPELSGLEQELERCLEADGTVSDSASSELARARSLVRDRRRELTTRLQRLVNKHGDKLAGGYYAERDGRYVLPVRSDSHGTIDGIVLGSSGSGATLYVEPRELVDLGNKLRIAEADAEREEARVLARLSAHASELGLELSVAREALLEAEHLIAMTRWAAKVSGLVFPPGSGTQSSGPSIELVAMRHPLLAAGEEPVIANDIRLRAGHALVISGPNAGGKTVALKCLGLAALMVRAGVPIPAAPGSSVGFFTEVLSDIGDDQSLALSLSTFSGHVRNLASMLDIARRTQHDDAGAGTLILLDELAAGTDPDQGAALATAVLEALAEARAAVAVTTHYEALKELAARDERFENASVGFDMTKLEPTFELRLGIPGPSSALAVAARFGMPTSVVERAKTLLPEQRLLRDELLDTIERQRQEAARALSSAKALELETQVNRNKIQAETLATAKRERDRLEREARELTQAVRQARADLHQVSQRLRAQELSQRDLKALEKTVDSAGRQLGVGGRLDQATRGAPGGAAPSADQLGLGTRVRVLPGGQVGEVAEPPVRGKLRVRVGSLTLLCKLADVRLATGNDSQVSSTRNTARVKAPKFTRSPSEPRDEVLLRHDGITLDLRGMRVDEALDEVDRFADGLLQRGEPAGFVLHGHGTGALKQAVRDHLRAGAAIARSRAAEREEGGDAFTVFWVR
ncbi:MAG: Smr/MutS family protein [Polyangiaceae bacterium]